MSDLAGQWARRTCHSLQPAPRRRGDRRGPWSPGKRPDCAATARPARLVLLEPGHARRTVDPAWPALSRQARGQAWTRLGDGRRGGECRRCRPAPGTRTSAVRGDRKPRTSRSAWSACSGPGRPHRGRLTRPRRTRSWGTRRPGGRRPPARATIEHPSGGRRACGWVWWDKLGARPPRSGKEAGRIPGRRTAYEDCEARSVRSRPAVVAAAHPGGTPAGPVPPPAPRCARHQGSEDATVSRPPPAAGTPQEGSMAGPSRAGWPGSSPSAPGSAWRWYGVTTWRREPGRADPDWRHGAYSPVRIRRGTAGRPGRTWRSFLTDLRGRPPRRAGARPLVPDPPRTRATQNGQPGTALVADPAAPAPRSATGSPAPGGAAALLRRRPAGCRPR